MRLSWPERERRREGGRETQAITVQEIQTFSLNSEHISGYGTKNTHKKKKKTSKGGRLRKDLTK